MSLMNDHILTLGQQTLSYALSPASGPPLLLVHGVTRKWQDFVPILPALTSRWQVTALTLRGHGGSSPTPGCYLLSDYIDDAEAMLREVCKRPTVVLGHSLGALVAVGLAARRPELVAALILEEPPSHRLVPHIRQTPFHALFTGLRQLAGKKRSIAETTQLVGQIEMPHGEGTIRLGDIRDATSLRFTARCLEDLDPEVLTPLIEGRLLEGFDWPDNVCRVKCPTLLLRGEVGLGGMLGKDDADEMASAMADAAVLQVPNVGHLLHWLATEETLRYVLGFLESLREE